MSPDLIRPSRLSITIFALAWQAELSSRHGCRLMKGQPLLLYRVTSLPEDRTSSDNIFRKAMAWESPTTKICGAVAGAVQPCRVIVKANPAPTGDDFDRKRR